jgi:hypothetical protein
MKASTVLSAIALAISVAVALFAMVRMTPFTFENTSFFGWVVTVLSVLVTALLGFQIYNYISVEKRINKTLGGMEQKIIQYVDEELKKKYDDLDKRYSELERSFDLRFKGSEADNMSQVSLNYFLQGQYKISLMGAFTALECYRLIENQEAADEMISRISFIIETIQLKKIKIEIDKEIKNEWLQTLLNMQNMDNRTEIENMIKFIDNYVRLK